MKEYYLTVKAKDQNVIYDIMQDLSSYNCDMHLDKTDASKMYVFDFNETSYMKLGERIGRTSSEYKKDMQYFNFVSNILDAYGILSTHKGFRYAIECVRLMNTYGLENYTMENDVYPIVSRWYDTSPNSIEHNIRNAITNAWERNVSSENPEEKNEMVFFRTKPSNVKFLKHISRLTFLSHIGAKSQ